MRLTLNNANADWLACQVQTSTILNAWSIQSREAEHRARSVVLTPELRDIFDKSVISALHGVSADLDSHAFTLAQTVCMAPRTGTQNTTALLRPH